MWLRMMAVTVSGMAFTATKAVGNTCVLLSLCIFTSGVVHRLAGACCMLLVGHVKGAEVLCQGLGLLSVLYVWVTCLWI